MSPQVQITPLPTAHRFQVGDDLAEHLLAAVDTAGERLADGDVVCVASKVVSLSEGQFVAFPEGAEDPKAARQLLAREHAAQIVADAPWVVITRTHHGFVAANGGIDASNLAEDGALLLPDDPDASAAALRQRLEQLTGVDLAVVVTDTFGRPWRMGQTEVALGVAGIGAIRDERGGTDLDGRPLEVTEAAIADEIASAADLVRDKSSGTPFVLLRGVTAEGRGIGADLVRSPDEDLFASGGPTAAERAVAARRTVRAYDLRQEVPSAAVEAAVAAAATAPAPHHTKPWRFLRLSDATRTQLLDAMAEQWEADLAADGTPAETIARRLAGSDRILRAAPALLVPFVVLDGAHAYPDARRTAAERDLFMLSGGAALANLQIVLAAHGLGAAWISSTVFCAPTVRAVLGLQPTWEPLGMIAIGRPAEAPVERPAGDASAFLLDR